MLIERHGLCDLDIVRRTRSLPVAVCAKKRVESPEKGSSQDEAKKQDKITIIHLETIVVS